MSSGRIDDRDPEIERDPNILLTRLDLAANLVILHKRKEQDAHKRLLLAQEESRKLSENCARLQGVEQELITALTETRQLRQKTAAATAQLFELESLREENRRLRERVAEVADAQQSLQSTQTELRDLRLRLQSANAKLSDAEAVADESRRLRARVEELREQAQIARALKTEIREVKLKLQSAGARLDDADRLASENQQLRQEVAQMQEIKEATLELEKITVENKQLRIENERLIRRLSEQSGAQDELFELRTRNAELAMVAEEATALREREHSLQAQLYAAGIEPRTYSSLPAVKPTEAGTIAHEIEANLKNLIGPDGAHSAILADNQGLLVAGAGDPRPHEGMAVLFGFAVEVGAKARTFLPIGNLHTLRLTDTNGLVVSYRFFQYEDSVLGVATITSSDAAMVNSEAAIASIVKAITST
jgi:hypothetical protein